MRKIILSFFLITSIFLLFSENYIYANDFEYNIDRPGLDYRNFDLNRNDPNICRQACLNDSACKAWTYVKPGIQGPNARCWLKNRVPKKVKNNCCVSGVKAKNISTGSLPSGKNGNGSGYKKISSVEYNIDRPGLDYRNFDLNRNDPNICRQACLNDSACKAWTYVKPGIQGPNARCWLKNRVPKKVKNNCCVSGVKAKNISTGSLP